MSLTMEQVQLVTQSYALIARSPRSYSELFYHRLLLDHPFARALFPDDMTHQIVIFAKTMDVLIENVESLDSLRPTLSDLAKRHVQYGVRAKLPSFTAVPLLFNGFSARRIDDT